MTTGFFLLDAPVRGPRKWYPERRSPVRLIVLHITAGLEDLDADDDQSAEATARYAATTDRAVSWHAGADTDSVVRLLPPSYTAFHCQGYNSSSLGLEISKRSIRWTGMDPLWTGRTLDHAAAAVRPWMAEFRIPPRLLTRPQVDAGHAGFTYHSRLDPTRRSDPGLDFPWLLFAARLTAPTPQPAPQEADVYLARNQEDGAIWQVQGNRRVRVANTVDASALAAAGFPVVNVTPGFIDGIPLA